MKDEAIKDLLFRMADDSLIFGHRNSEWTGLGPIVEEDLAFSSMAQDKIGHALALYEILHNEFGEADPDQLAFLRNENEFKCCHLAELPNGEYDFSLARQFYFAYAEYLRFEALENSSHKSLADLARRVKGELKYHVMHAQTWMSSLASGTEESKARMQTAINELASHALGIFESEGDEALVQKGVFIGEVELKKLWLQAIAEQLDSYGMQTPDFDNIEPVAGGRKGYHTEHLAPLLEEMGEVLRMDPTAEW